MTYVFVYGSLKEGFSNHRHLRKATRIGTAHTANPYLMLGGFAFPYVIDPAVLPGGRGIYVDFIGMVKGEVYKVDRQTMDRLDVLEGHPDFYKRELVDVRVNGGDYAYNVMAWLYFLQCDGLTATPRIDASKIIMPDEAGFVEWTQERVSAPANGEE